MITVLLAQTRNAVITGLGVAALLVNAAATTAQADVKIKYPNVDYREVEIENNTSTTFDKRPEKNDRRSVTQEVGVGVLPFWFVELEGEFGREPSEKWQWKATTLENYFMLTEPGKYWIDASLYAEFSRAKSLNDPNTVKIGGLFQKDYKNIINTFTVWY